MMSCTESLGHFEVGKETNEELLGNVIIIEYFLILFYPAIISYVYQGKCYHYYCDYYILCGQ